MLALESSSVSPHGFLTQSLLSKEHLFSVGLLLSVGCGRRRGQGLALFFFFHLKIFFNFFKYLFIFLLVIHFTHISVYRSIPISQFITPPPPPPAASPLGVHTFVLYICVSISALQTGSSVPFSRFHIYALIYDTCFSLPDLLHSV